MNKGLSSIASLIAGFALVVAPAYASNNCCRMTGTTIGCAGSENFLVICGIDWPPVMTCTGSTPGAPYPNAEFTGPTGTDHNSPAVGWCGSLW